MADQIVQQDSEGRYGYGTTPVMETFLRMIGESKKQNTMLFLVNLGTLVRNTADGKMSVDDVVEKVCTYMSNMATDYAAAVSEWRAYNHFIVFYHAVNGKVLWGPARRVTHSVASLSAKEAMVKLTERLKHVKEQKSGNTTSIIAVEGNLRQPSYKGLAELCSKLTPVGVVINMISHNPIDWHIGYLGRKAIMYRSYTGVAVEMTPRNLGPIVFDNPNVPFTPVTHVLLGDKSFLRGFLRGKDKESFLEAARREKFILRSENYIISTARINLGLLPYRL